MNKSCDVCEHGEPQEWASFSNKRCEEHDRCITCNTKRKDMDETPFCNRYGIQCRPCMERGKQIAKDEYQALIDKDEISDDDWSYNSQMVCPYCGHEQEDDEHSYVNADEELVECGNCDSYYKVTGYIEITYTTSRVEENKP